jgi:hypothetical protein
VLGVIGQLGAVSVTVGAAGHGVVDARVFDGEVVQSLLTDLVGQQVDAPAGQRRLAGGEGLTRFRVEGPVVADHVHHHLVAVVIGVEHMEDVDGVDRDPMDVTGVAAPRHDTDTGTCFGHPPEGKGATGGSQGQIEHDGEVEEHHPGGGHPEVVHHDGTRYVDGPGVDEGAVCIDHVISEERRTEDVVSEENQLATFGIAFGVGGHG